MFFGCTTKYGTFVPSLLFAKSCSTVRLDASNCAFSVFATDRVPLAASPNQTEGGVKNPVTDMKKLSSALLMDVMPTATLSGSASLVFAQPVADGVYA